MSYISSDLARENPDVPSGTATLYDWMKERWDIIWAAKFLPDGSCGCTAIGQMGIRKLYASRHPRFENTKTESGKLTECSKSTCDSENNLCRVSVYSCENVNVDTVFETEIHKSVNLVQ